MEWAFGAQRLISTVSDERHQRDFHIDGGASDGIPGFQEPRVLDKHHWLLPADIQPRSDGERLPSRVTVTTSISGSPPSFSYNFADPLSGSPITWVTSHFFNSSIIFCADGKSFSSSESV